ncbi:MULTISPECIES: hypothetical protein [unclassified Bradyrhizobium]
MWPSLEVANRIADISNGVLVTSLVVGVISTALSIWMTNVKEGHWEAARHSLEQRLTPRKMTLEQMKSISKTMAVFASAATQNKTQRAFISAYPSSTEAASLAEQVRAALSDAGWQIDEVPDGFIKSQVPRIGVIIFTTDSSRGKSIGLDLASALNASGIEANVSDVPMDYFECKKYHLAENIDPICSPVIIVVGEYSR